MSVPASTVGAVTDRPPLYNAPAFDCPHCGAYAQQAWSECFAHDEDGDSFDPSIHISTCFSCGRWAIWHKHVVGAPGTIAGSLPMWRLVYPLFTNGGPPRSADMPAEVAALYNEAAEVVAASPRSASVLLRLALESLLEGLYPDAKGNLNEMIGAAVEAVLPKRVQQAMDVMRFGGNTSAHEIRHEDTVETAFSMFRLLNIVVENLITEPKDINALFEGLPDAKKAQVERRDGT